MPPAHRITWRPAAAGDAAFLRQLYASTRAAELAAAGWDAATCAAFTQMQFELQQRAYLAQFPAAVCRVVELERDASSQPIGRLWLDSSPPSLRLLDIGLLPEHRGAGIGGQLLRDLQGQAQGRPIALQVEQSNPARRLYARLGFVEDPKQAQGLYLAMLWRPSGTAILPLPRQEPVYEQA